jgi:hypothetical protein
MAPLGGERVRHPPPSSVRKDSTMRFNRDNDRLKADFFIQGDDIVDFPELPGMFVYGGELDDNDVSLSVYGPVDEPEPDENAQKTNPSK